MARKKQESWREFKKENTGVSKKKNGALGKGACHQTADLSLISKAYMLERE
jgi:hypothetical protein